MPDNIQFPVGSSAIPTSTTLTQLENEKRRNAFVAESVRVRLALLIRALREQREWSQADLGQIMGKPQSNISKFEDPDYGKYSLATLLEFAAAFRLPLYIDMPEWDDWFRLMADHSTSNLHRRSFDKDYLIRARDAGAFLWNNVNPLDPKDSLSSWAVRFFGQAVSPDDIVFASCDPNKQLAAGWAAAPAVIQTEQERIALGVGGVEIKKLSVIVGQNAELAKQDTNVGQVSWRPGQSDKQEIRAI